MADPALVASGRRMQYQDDVRRLDYDRSKVLKGGKVAIHWTQAKEGWPSCSFRPVTAANSPDAFGFRRESLARSRWLSWKKAEGRG